MSSADQPVAHSTSDSPPADVVLPDATPTAAAPPAPDDAAARLEQLGDRIAELSARIWAATWELLTLIREFDAQDGWSGCLSCAQGLSWRTGLAPGAAREHVRVARALGDLPKLSDAMRRGRISYSEVRAVTRVATPENEQTLLDVALAGTAEHVEQVVRGWRRVDRAAEQAENRRRDLSRALRTWVDEDGMVVVRGRLTPEVGAVLRRALEAACEEARLAPASEETGAAEGADAAAGAEDQPTLAQRQADAIGMVAEAALAGGLDKGTAADRYQVVLHVDAEALAGPRDVPAGTSAHAAAGTGERQRGRDVAAETSDSAMANADPRRCDEYVPAGTRRGSSRRWRRTTGPCPGAGRGSSGSGAPKRPGASPTGSQTVLDEAGGIHASAETARRAACDAATVTMRHGAGGEVLDVGRRTRTLSPALRRALAARDRQCRFPGCGNRRCDAHHIEHWADGGRTALDKLVSLCRRHHRAVH
ncbi:MAG: DUF222 domain-containing protein [Acidobacteria bacterium]|nr:DUF222 domain-containing protein [Acidobacteriota bacterium]